MIANILPFKFIVQGEEYILKDIRTVSPELQIETKFLQQHVLETRFPPEIICSSNFSRDLDQQKALIRSNGNKILYEKYLAEYKDIDKSRQSFEFFKGDIHPITFTMLKQNNFFGAWQWYGINIINETFDNINIKCCFFPAFPLDYSDRGFAKLLGGMVLSFLNTPIRLENNKTITVLKASSPLYNEKNRKDTIISNEIKKFFIERKELHTVIKDESHKRPGKEFIEINVSR